MMGTFARMDLEEGWRSIQLIFASARTDRIRMEEREGGPHCPILFYYCNIRIREWGVALLDYTLPMTHD
jgi:hypothetical protein